MPDQIKVRGSVDLVFLIDATARLAPALDGVRSLVTDCVDALISAPFTMKWRARVIGFRDRYVDGDIWYEPAPFSGDPSVVKGQMACLKASGGDSGKVSLLDALLQLAGDGETGSCAPDSPTAWRPRSKVRDRVVVVLCNSAARETSDDAHMPNNVECVVQACMESRLALHIVSPGSPVYESLAQTDKCEYCPVDELGVALTQPDERNAILLGVLKSCAHGCAGNPPPVNTVESRGPFLFLSSDASQPICPDCWKDGIIAKLKYGHPVGPDLEFMCMREKKLKRFKGGLPPPGLIIG